MHTKQCENTRIRLSGPSPRLILSTYIPAHPPVRQFSCRSQPTLLLHHSLAQIRFTTSKIYGVSLGLVGQSPSFTLSSRSPSRRLNPPAWKPYPPARSPTGRSRGWKRSRRPGRAILLWYSPFCTEELSIAFQRPVGYHIPPKCLFFIDYNATRYLPLKDLKRSALICGLLRNEDCIAEIEFC